MDRRFYVYALFRPDTGEPFYIGKGCGRRWLRSENDRRTKNRHKAILIENFKARGLEIPKVLLASGLAEDEAFATEAALIAAIGRTPDGPLANATDGGGGRSGSIVAPETRAAISAKMKGVPKSPIMCERLGASRRGKKTGPRKTKRIVSAEARANMAAAATGRKLSVAHKAKIAKACTGRKHRPEVLAIMRERWHEWHQKTARAGECVPSV